MTELTPRHHNTKSSAHQADFTQLTGNVTHEVLVITIRKTIQSPLKMFSIFSILMLPLLVLSNPVPTSNATLAIDARDHSPETWFTKPWCIYVRNGPTDSWAVMIPKDGSKEVAGVDAAGKCGKKFSKNAAAHGIAGTEWYVPASCPANIAKIGASLAK